MAFPEILKQRTSFFLIFLIFISLQLDFYNFDSFIYCRLHFI